MFAYASGLALLTSSVTSGTQFQSPPAIVWSDIFWWRCEKKFVRSLGGDGAYMEAMSSFISFVVVTRTRVTPGSLKRMLSTVAVSSATSMKVPPLCTLSAAGGAYPIMASKPQSLAMRMCSSCCSGSRLCSCPKNICALCKLHQCLASLQNATYLPGLCTPPKFILTMSTFILASLALFGAWVSTCGGEVYARHLTAASLSWGEDRGL